MNSNSRTFNYPFKRPWLKDNGAAAAAAGGNKGVKGIIAGNVIKLFNYLLKEIMQDNLINNLSFI